MLLAKCYSCYVPFAVVQGVCKYAGDKVGNRLIAVVQGRPSIKINMSNGKSLLRTIWAIGFVLTSLISTSAHAGFPGFGGENWKEEVQLQDGQKLIIERSQTRGGNHEIGQEVPIAGHKISFRLPGSKEAITWSSTYGYDRDHSNLILLAVDVVHGVPYIVATTLICPAYNKWDRPNPPYVYFKYVGKEWQRIPLIDFPPEIKGANIVINMAKYSGLLTVKEVNEINANNDTISMRYLRQFVREPINNVVTNCSKFD
jgi:hypothetical protein